MKIEISTKTFWKFIDDNFDIHTEKGRLKILLTAGILFLLGAMLHEIIALLVLFLILILVIRYYSKRGGPKFKEKYY